MPLTPWRWVFYDPGTDESYTVEMNPNAGGSPPYKKNLAYRNTAAPDGKTLIFEGRREVQTLEFSGTILTETHYQAFVTWWEVRNQVRITDDLGREWWVIIVDFEPTRVRAARYPWKHTFTCRATIVTWPS